MNQARKYGLKSVAILRLEEKGTALGVLQSSGQTPSTVES